MISNIDLVAIIVFIALWGLYSRLADHRSGKKGSLVKVMHRYRVEWIKQLVKREDRLVDVRIIANLLRTSIFLASTSILIIAGLVGIIGFANKAVPIISQVPFAVETNQFMWAVKTIFLVSIFVYSFFKFTWVIRQLNYVTVVIAATPTLKTNEMKTKGAKHVNKIATIISNAGRHFNMGVRSYYFGLAALSWYISPVLFICASIFVIIVIYRREFLSKTLEVLL